MIDILLNRRTIRKYSTKAVGNSLINEIISAGCRTSTTGNMQVYSIIITRDAGMKKELAPLHFNQNMVTEAPVVLIVLADLEGWKKGNIGFEKDFVESVKAGIMKQEQYDWFTGATASLYGISSDRIMAFACKNAAFFGMSLMLAAKNAGLDSHPMDGFDIDGVKKAFDIPDQCWVPLLLAIGHFDKSKTLFPAKWRKSYNEIVVNFNDTR